jgi:hypothetical protein
MTISSKVFENCPHNSRDAIQSLSSRNRFVFITDVHRPHPSPLYTGRRHPTSRTPRSPPPPQEPIKDLVHPSAESVKAVRTSVISSPRAVRTISNETHSSRSRLGIGSTWCLPYYLSVTRSYQPLKQLLLAVVSLIPSSNDACDPSLLLSEVRTGCTFLGPRCTADRTTFSRQPSIAPMEIKKIYTNGLNKLRESTCS